MPIAIRLPKPGPEDFLLVVSNLYTFSKLMDIIDGMEVDTVICFDKTEIELKTLRRALVKFYNERGLSKSFTLKPTPSAHKIWRWK